MRFPPYDRLPTFRLERWSDRLREWVPGCSSDSWFWIRLQAARYVSFGRHRVRVLQGKRCVLNSCREIGGRIHWWVRRGLDNARPEPSYDSKTPPISPAPLYFIGDGDDPEPWDWQPFHGDA